MREHVQILVALAIMVACALLLTLSRNSGMDPPMWWALADVPLVLGIIFCLAFLIIKAGQAIRKAGQD